MKYVIDRIEEDIAICEREDGGIEGIPLALLYDSAAEGDHFSREDGVSTYLPEETESARRRNAELQRRLFEG